MPFALVCVYRHPSGKKAHFTKCLEKTLELIDKKCTTIVAGDTNIDLIKFEQDDNFNYATTMFAMGYLPYITLPTRITSHSATCIDHIFVKTPHLADKLSILSGIIYADISDHLPCFLSFNLPKYSKTGKRPMVRLYGDSQCCVFQEKMLSFGWDEIYTDDGDWFSNFVSAVHSIFTSSFPLVVQSRKRSKDKPWITKGLKVSVKQSHRLYRNTLGSASVNAVTKYKKYKNMLRKCIQVAETTYYTDIFDNNKTSAKNTWRHLNSMINPSRKTHSMNIDKIFYENKMYTNPNDVADKINEHFCNVGTKLKNKLSPHSENAFKDFLPPRIMNSFYLADVLYEDVIREIKKLNPRKATGADGIGNKILLLCPDIFAHNLVKIFNKSIADGVYPCELKLARVIP